METSAAGLELGFNKNATEKRTGVRTCSSFTWSMAPELLFSRIKQVGLDSQQKCIVNEYKDEFTLDEFIKLRKACPIVFKKIGQRFS